MTDIRKQISNSLAAFSQRPLAEAALTLFQTLGYQNEIGKRPTDFRGQSMRFRTRVPCFLSLIRKRLRT